jgi:hypothetical protein
LGFLIEHERMSWLGVLSIDADDVSRAIRRTLAISWGIAMETITSLPLDAADDCCETLIDAHRDLPNEPSHALDRRLALLLANHIGTQHVPRKALTAAREDAR